MRSGLKMPAAVVNSYDRPAKVTVIVRSLGLLPGADVK
jgi:hypothetical protein